MYVLLSPYLKLPWTKLIKLAHKLSQRVGDELSIPVYCYENGCKRKKKEEFGKLSCW